MTTIQLNSHHCEEICMVLIVDDNQLYANERKCVIAHSFIISNVPSSYMLHCLCCSSAEDDATT